MNIYEKMLKITEAVQNIEKKGRNTFSNYDYVRAVDVVAEVQKCFTKEKVFLSISEIAHKKLSEVREKDGKAVGFNHYSEIQCRAVFVNAEKPEEKIEVYYFAEAADTGDKAIYKAKTGGLKYVLTQNFMIVTDALVDPEQDNKYDTHNQPETPKETKKETKKPDPKQPPEMITKFQLDKIEKLVMKTADPDKSMDWIMTHYHINTYQELTKVGADEIITKMEKK